MDKPAERGRGRNDLMGGDFTRIFLSEDVMCSSNKTTGDRLRCFLHHKETLQNPCPVGSGEHGVAILAIVEDVQYLFKVFKKWKEPGPVFASSYGEAIETSPLAKECRAFARLDLLNKNDTWAVRCYGWMKLTDEQFKTLGNVVDNHDLSRWAIVKEYLPTPTLPTHIPTIFANFEIPRMARILPQDVRLENYRGSKIFDLSCTLTDPCPEWSEFLFHRFYQKTTPGVLFAWFKCPSKGYASKITIPVYQDLSPSLASFSYSG